MARKVVHQVAWKGIRLHDKKAGWVLPFLSRRIMTILYKWYLIIAPVPEIKFKSWPYQNLRLGRISLIWFVLVRSHGPGNMLRQLEESVVPFAAKKIGNTEKFQWSKSSSICWDRFFDRGRSRSSPPPCGYGFNRGIFWDYYKIWGNVEKLVRRLRCTYFRKNH